MALIANATLQSSEIDVKGEVCLLEEEKYYKVKNYNAMPCFLMSIVSDTDHWMYISSSGGLTAGRKNSDHSLFPYYTDDKIHESAENTGSKTIVKLETEKGDLLWDAFSDKYSGLYKISRNLYKSLINNSLIFEEINHDLELQLQIKWMNSEQYGWIRKIELTNLSEDSLSVTILDGLLNILPSGILKTTQETYSTLMDAYKKSEILENTNLGIYSLSSVPVDRPEPSEALKATTVWTTAKNIQTLSVSDHQIDKFREGENIIQELNSRGQRSSYLLETKHEIKAKGRISYYIVAELDQDSKAVHNLNTALIRDSIQEKDIEADRAKGSENLIAMVAEADGIQEGADNLVAARHFSNVLFNIMRGGIYDSDYQLKTKFLLRHVEHFNKSIYENEKTWLVELPETINYTELIEYAQSEEKDDLLRLFLEYLPLTFSRRHGDPSRPWNRFSIEVKNDDGSRSLAYEGNWRDIFQNWEALSYSYPAYLPGIISKFLNASTIDGYNPYRITSKGIDWEIFEPENPWSFIGYWGDHQIIYLEKLLELQEKFYPGTLKRWLRKNIFVYANVPYRIKPYEDILQNPQVTIDFDEELNREIEKRTENIGADGKLVQNGNGALFQVSLAEKLLLPLLTKLSNFIPGAGIWMNTQRPEWNDANNALVGNGVSMVTLYYIRRYLSFLNELFIQEKEELFVTKELGEFFETMKSALLQNSSMLGTDINAVDRKKLCDMLGLAGAEYRKSAYKGMCGETSAVSIDSVTQFISVATEFVDHTICLNKRDDGLYHAYNLISIEENSIHVENLQEMLEGQVAYLSSGKANIDDALALLDALKASSLYRKDQDSYILYPDKEFTSFLDINNIDKKAINSQELVEKLLQGGGYGILNEDDKGCVHFCGDFRNATILKEALDAKRELQLSEKEEAQLLELYEAQFNHHAFTGRSGSFFKYEGLGSIYWHMVSKLLLSVGELLNEFSKTETDKAKINKLKDHYAAISLGIGVHKNPREYGAIPTDPYSHTPSMMGAQQPGMTGQVKEDIISRLIELGIEIVNGEIHVRQEMINRNELNDKGELTFTFCSIPFTYRIGTKEGICIHHANETIELPSFKIDKVNSKHIFSRSKIISSVTVNLSK